MHLLNHLPIKFFLAGLIYFSPVTENRLWAQQRPSAQQVSIEKKLIDGNKYIMLGDWEKAEALFKSVLDEDINNSAACFELSRTLAASGRTGEALTYIQRAVRLEPDNEWYLLMEADIREKTGDLPATMEVYDRLIKLRPGKPHYYEMQISLCKKTGEHERLLNVLNAYESSVGLTASITRTRFETLDTLKRQDEALAALHKMTVVFPYQIDYKFLAASYALKIGQEEKARSYYRDILAIDPQNSRAKLAMASTEKQAGDNVGYLQSILPVISNPAIEMDIKLKEIIPYVLEFSKTNDALLGNALLDVTNQLIITHPKDAKSYAIHGDVLSIFNRRPEAIEAYTHATTINGGVYIVWEQMLALLMAERSYDALIRESGRAIEHFPNQAYLYYAQGYGYHKKGQYNQALDVLNEALLMTGKNQGQKISVYNLLGLTYDELGDLDKASVAFESSLAIDPRNPETLAQYSLMLSRRITQSEKAIAMTERVMSQPNLTPAIYEIVAEALYNQKKYNEAYAAIQKVLDSDPHPDTWNMAGDILIKMGNTQQAVAMWQKALDTGCTDPDLKRKISDPKAQ